MLSEHIWLVGAGNTLDLGDGDMCECVGVLNPIKLLFRLCTELYLNKNQLKIKN